MPMLILTALISFLAVIGSFGITNKVKGYMALILLLETGMMGVFVSLDFFLFYVFWEVMLLPMYFLIGIWGGPRKEYAAIKFFLYTLVGSVLMLLALLALYFNTTNPETGGHTFNLLHYMAQGTHNALVEGVRRRGSSSSSGSSSASPSRCRSSRSTPGSPTPTSRRPRRSPSSWRASC